MRLGTRKVGKGAVRLPKILVLARGLLLARHIRTMQLVSNAACCLQTRWKRDRRQASPVATAQPRIGTTNKVVLFFCTYKKMTAWKPNEYSSTPELPSSLTAARIARRGRACGASSLMLTAIMTPASDRRVGHGRPRLLSLVILEGKQGIPL